MSKWIRNIWIKFPWKYTRVSESNRVTLTLSPVHSSSAVGLGVGNSPLLHTLTNGIAYSLATQDAPSFSPEIPSHVLWFSGQVAGMGWERRGQLVKEMNEKKKGGARSRQPKCLEDRPCAACRGGQRLWLRSGFGFGALCKAVQDVSFLSKQHKISWPMLTVLCFPGFQGVLESAPKTLQGLGQAMLKSPRRGTYERKPCLKVDLASQSTFCLPYTKSLSAFLCQVKVARSRWNTSLCTWEFCRLMHLPGEQSQSWATYVLWSSYPSFLALHTLMVGCSPGKSQ